MAVLTEGALFIGLADALVIEGDTAKKSFYISIIVEDAKKGFENESVRYSKDTQKAAE